MASFGEELKRERELRDISLREVAEATKVNIRYLEAMERNDFEHLPGGVFNRGFVRAYAQYIGIDADAMVDAYLLEESAQTRRPAGTDERMLRRPSERRTGPGARREKPPVRPAPPEPRPAPARRWTIALVAAFAAAVLALATALAWWLRQGGAGS